ncbi:Coiled-coil domain-containing protein 174 [Geodia barretti]|nr:Coiled-coil domain-containing protein 174 [Geodia barretti]
MAMERERRRWEEEVEGKLDKPVGPVHYEELRRGEIRTHGVGYYAFSQEEEKRAEQLSLLNKLRDQTVSQREKKAKLQEKRKAQMAARLEKVRQRKQLKPPEVEEKGEEEEEGKLVGGLVEGERREEDPLAAMIESELGKAREKAEKGGGEERDGGVAKKPYVRPWDKGKIVDPIRKRKKELEDERFSEFAPPSSYKNSATELPKVAKMDNTDQKSDQSRPLGDQGHKSATEIPEEVPNQNVAESGAASGPPPPPPQNYYQYQPPMFAFPPPFMPSPLFGPVPPPPHGPIPNFRPPPNWYPYFHPPPPPPTMPPSQSPQ